VKIGFHGYGFGARHIDAQGNFMEEVVRETAKFIPEDALRFALGVGTPEDIVRCYGFGWDMFDCVIPTREGRHGRLFIRKNTPSPLQGEGWGEVDFYETININNGKYKNDFSRLDENCDCELCKNHTKAYLHHLFASKEMLGMRLSAIHNLKFYVDLMGALRNNVNSKKIKLKP
jgi:queuine tRNA-ribosyltransferase